MTTQIIENFILLVYFLLMQQCQKGLFLLESILLSIFGRLPEAGIKPGTFDSNHISLTTNPIVAKYYHQLQSEVKQS